MPSASSSARVAAALLLGVAATAAMSTVPALAAQIGPTQDGIGFAGSPGKPSYVNRRTVTVRTFVLDRSRRTPADGVLYALCAQRT
jgi:hypothetical protein